MSDDPIIAVPANLEFDERLVGPVTFRMAGWLAASAVGAVLLGIGELTVPRLLLGVPLVVLGLVGAFWRPGGRNAAAWLRPLAAYLRRRRVEHTEPAADPSATVDSAADVGHQFSLTTGWRLAVGSTGRRLRRVARPASMCLLAANVLMGAFITGRALRGHQNRTPSPPAVTPAPAAPVPAPTAPFVVDPWSDCGC